MKKKIFFIIALLILICVSLGIIIFLKLHKEKESVNVNISLDELNKNIIASNQLDISKMQDINIDYACLNFLIDKEKIKGIIGKAPLINVKSSMYVVIKTEDESVQDVKLALESYASEYENQWSNYLPDQYEIVKNRKIGIIGNYVYMIISENPDEIIKFIK